MVISAVVRTPRIIAAAICRLLLALIAVCVYIYRAAKLQLVDLQKKHSDQSSI